MVCAGVDFYGTTLHYAETEQVSGHAHLLRLGSCDFDFDVGDALLRGAAPRHLNTLAEALEDLFAGSPAGALRVVLHPPACPGFFAPLPAELAAEKRHARLLHEASMLVPAGGRAGPLRLTTDTLYEEPLEGGGALEWNHVLVLHRPVHDRFDRLMERLPQATYRWSASTHGAARAVGRVRRDDAEAAHGAAPGYTLAIGQYAGHVEYALCRDGAWRFGYHAEVEAPSDSAYFAVAVLQRLGVELPAIERVLLYGPRAQRQGREALDPLRRLMGQAAFARFDLADLVDLDPKSLRGAFDTGAYIPAIGAAL